MGVFLARMTMRIETIAALDAAALVHALHGHRAVPLLVILSTEKG
jgi:hypothetical protein